MKKLNYHWQSIKFLLCLQMLNLYNQVSILTTISNKIIVVIKVINSLQIFLLKISKIPHKNKFCNSNNNPNKINIINKINQSPSTNAMIVVIVIQATTTALILIILLIVQVSTSRTIKTSQTASVKDSN